MHKLTRPKPLDGSYGFCEWCNTHFMTCQIIVEPEIQTWIALCKENNTCMHLWWINIIIISTLKENHTPSKKKHMTILVSEIKCLYKCSPLVADVILDWLPSFPMSSKLQQSLQKMSTIYPIKSFVAKIQITY